MMTYIGCMLIFFGIQMSSVHVMYADSWEEIRQATADMQSIRAEFVQEKHMKILKKPIQATGTFFYKQPHSLRWEYSHPIQSILLMHNGTIKRYIFNKDKGWIADTSPNLMNIQIAIQQMTEWMNGRMVQGSAFIPEFTDDRKLILRPKEKAMTLFIEKIELAFSKQDGIMDSVTIFENNDSYTKINYLNTKLNSVLPESLFTDIAYEAVSSNPVHTPK
ncbi:MAG: outer membrane lipoprotein carrier protein LolA [Desulfobacterales bacterium]|nr:outer membrane lipoprotein carrier protein LolA [Desulfobacterales bacterium]